MSGSRRAHLAILLTLVLGYNVASSQLLDFYGNVIIIKLNESIVCNSQLECVPKTCNEGRMCMWLTNKFVQYATVICDKEMDTPYCNNGICSKTTERPECVKGGESSSQFVCPATGTYPDPSSCTIYHKCVNRVRTTNVCPRNNVYDHESGDCKYVNSITNANCVTINCIRKEGQSFVYPRDDRIYGKCLLGKPYILGRCKNYERYDLVENKCVRHCRAIGVQPPYDPEECRKYVYCAKVSLNKYEPVEMSCACNEGYDEKANSCVQDAVCLKNISDPCKKQEENSEGGGNGNSSEQPENKGNDGTNLNTDQVSPLIINNSGNNNNENNVSNGDDKINGNLVNGNNNGDNNNSGNVANGDPVPSPLIINNSGNNNGNNNITNGNDNVNGNLVNGNNNGDNRESGNVQRRNAPTIDNYIINNSGNNNNKNDVSNGDDSVDGNIVNGNDNGDNVNSGNVKNEDLDVPQLPPIINDSVENDNGNNDEVSNEADGNATDEDGNDNNNDNSDNVDTSQPIENPKSRKIFNFLRILFDWVIRITIGQLPVN